MCAHVCSPMHMCYYVGVRTGRRQEGKERADVLRLESISSDVT